MSSAGLVYVHFGQEILSQILGTPIDSELVQETYKKVYESFIEEIVMLLFHICLIFGYIPSILSPFNYRMPLIMESQLMMDQADTRSLPT